MNAYYKVDNLQAGQAYLFSFSCRNGGLHGSQFASAQVVDGSGRLLFAFPDGAGYRCPPSAATTAAYFAFEAPPQAVSATLLVRATGEGEAAFGALDLNQIVTQGA